MVNSPILRTKDTKNIYNLPPKPQFIAMIALIDQLQDELCAKNYDKKGDEIWWLLAKKFYL